MAEIEWAAWNGQVVPQLERMKAELLPAGTAYADPNQQVPEENRIRTRIVYTGLFTPGPDAVDLAKEQLVRWLLGSHEYLLQCIEAWATQITVRYGLDEMFDIQWTLWGDSVLPVKELKAEYLGITGNTVEAWMKDLQLDATALPGKAFDLPEHANRFWKLISIRPPGPVFAVSSTRRYDRKLWIVESVTPAAYLPG